VKSAMMQPAVIRRTWRVLLVFLAACLLCACSARWAYRQGQAAGKKGDWDLAVARMTKAVDRNPDSVRYRLALDNARSQAARQHFKKGQQHLAAEDLDRALEEFEIAARFDPSYVLASEKVRETETRIARREEERKQREELAQRKEAAAAARYPLPVLSPRDRAPIHLKFQDASLRTVSLA
jgi:tetratricopeptide (TPR) repeat protein